MTATHAQSNGTQAAERILAQIMAEQPTTDIGFLAALDRGQELYVAGGRPNVQAAKAIFDQLRRQSNEWTTFAAMRAIACRVVLGEYGEAIKLADEFIKQYGEDVTATLAKVLRERGKAKLALGMSAAEIRADLNRAQRLFQYLGLPEDMAGVADIKRQLAAALNDQDGANREATLATHLGNVYGQPHLPTTAQRFAATAAGSGQIHSPEVRRPAGTSAN